MATTKKNAAAAAMQKFEAALQMVAGDKMPTLLVFGMLAEETDRFWSAEEFRKLLDDAVKRVERFKKEKADVCAMGYALGGTAREVWEKADAIKHSLGKTTSSQTHHLATRLADRVLKSADGKVTAEMVDAVKQTAKRVVPVDKARKDLAASPNEMEKRYQALVALKVKDDKAWAAEIRKELEVKMSETKKLIEMLIKA